MRSIFGLHLEGARVITITGTPRYSGAPLFCGSGDGEGFKWTGVAASGSTWTLSLEAGDYVVRLEDDEAQGTVTITPSDPVVLATIPANAPYFVVVGTLGKQVSVVTGNPKDPWPPPQSATQIPGASMTWLTTYLSPHFGLPRSEGDGASPRG
jgi:hypothetical protein